MPVADDAARAAAMSGLADGTPDGTVMPVVNYWFIWGILGAFLVLVVVGYYLWAYLATRPRRKLPDLAPPPLIPQLGEVRGRYLGRVDEVEHRYRAGALSSRRAHAELSVIVRDYVAEATGVRADRMTLTDLRHTNLRATAHTVGQFYPIVFGTREYRGVDQGARAARSVITTWL